MRGRLRSGAFAAVAAGALAIGIPVTARSPRRHGTIAITAGVGTAVISPRSSMCC